MKDPKDLTATQLIASMGKAAAASRALIDEMIDAGRGHEVYSQTRGKRDELSLRYVAAVDHERDLLDEHDRRMTFHGRLARTRSFA